MEKIPSSFPLSKHGKRELSSFTADQMLYDHLTGRLDLDRELALVKKIENSLNLRRELGRMRGATSYAERLAKLQTPVGAIDKIDEPDTYLSVLLKKSNFERWPLAIRWGTEAAVVLGFFLIILVVMPWNHLLNFGLSPQGREIILAEVNRPKKGDFNHPLTVAAPTEDSGFEDEGVGVKSTAAAESDPPVIKSPGSLLPTAETNLADIAMNPVPPSAPLSGKVPAQVAAAVPKPAPTPVAPAAKPITTAAIPPPASNSSGTPAAGEGGLFRGVLQVTNLDATSPKIIEKIEALGGRKAGQVELGWKKTTSSSYFHFTMPQAKYDDLVTFLSDYGAAKLVKEKHPRVMPEGIIRLIITVEEAEK